MRWPFQYAIPTINLDQPFSSTMSPAQQVQYDEDMRKERIIKAQMADEKVADQRMFLSAFCHTTSSPPLHWTDFL